MTESEKTNKMPTSGMVCKETAVSQAFFYQSGEEAEVEELHQQPPPGKGVCRREATAEQSKQR